MTAVPSSRYAIFASLVILGCLADLATKSWAFSRLGGPREQPALWVVEDVCGFQTSLNEGALFGVGQGRVHLFSVLSVVAAVSIIYWLFFLQGARDLLLTVALGSVTAGILGNLYDRLGMPGLQWKAPWGGGPLHQVGDPVYAVRDWIHVIIIKWPWPTFNLADSMLVCGATLLVWHAAASSRHTEACP